ncbi:hypothetical protein ACQP2U_43730 (plasmid) [Nocardia sp. CA-084685]|uniref:hypothetical protein n=1 Tax=Nocardia sp. CA-084685 TaxID=3239970 RepID=UPI003D952360
MAHADTNRDELLTEFAEFFQDRTPYNPTKRRGSFLSLGIAVIGRASAAIFAGKGIAKCSGSNRKGADEYTEVARRARRLAEIADALAQLD